MNPQCKSVEDFLDVLHICAVDRFHSAMPIMFNTAFSVALKMPLEIFKLNSEIYGRTSDIYGQILYHYSEIY